MTRFKYYFNNNLGTIIAFVLGALIFGAPLVRSFVEPACAPPGCNVEAPLNEGETNQAKKGRLVLNTMGQAIGLVVNGAVDFWGNLNFINKSRITNLGAPIDGSDAATKSYVDAAAGSGGTTQYNLYEAKNGQCNAYGCSATATCSSGFHIFESVCSTGMGDSKIGRKQLSTTSLACYGFNNTSSSYPIYASIVCESDFPRVISAPSGLTSALVFPPAKINLSWTNNMSAGESIKLERKTNTGSFSVIATLPITATSYADTTAAESATYTYRAYIYNSGGANSPYSNEAATNIQGVLAAGGLSWDAASNCVIYDNGNSQSCNSVLRWTDNSAVETGYEMWECIRDDTSSSPLDCSNTVNYTRLTSGRCKANAKGVKVELRNNDIKYAKNSDFVSYYVIKGLSSGAPHLDSWSSNARVQGVPARARSTKAIPLGDPQDCVY